MQTTKTKHPCALKGCKTPATKWTMCDRHAKSMNIYVRREKQTYRSTPKYGTTGKYSPRGVNLSDDVWEQVKAAVTVNSVASVAKATGVTCNPLYRIRDSETSIKLSESVVGRITRWADAGAPVPPQRHPKPRWKKSNPNSRKPIEQYHIDTARLIADSYGGFGTAGKQIGLSRSALDTMAKHRKPGDLAAPQTLERIEAWGTLQEVSNSSDRPTTKEKI